MDPNASLHDLTLAIQDGDLPAAYESACYLYDWLDRAGCMPNLTGRWQSGMLRGQVMAWLLTVKSLTRAAFEAVESTV